MTNLHTYDRSRPEHRIGHIVDTLIIDSKDRESYSTSTTDFEIKIPNPGRRVRFFRFRKIIIPLVMDNITSSNNTVEFADVASNVDVGLYNITGLMDWMTTNIATYTFTLLDNNRVKIDNGGGAAFKFEPLEMATVLGFTSTTYTGANTYTAEESPNLLIDQYYTLHSTYIAKRAHHDTTHTDRRSDIVVTVVNNAHVGDPLIFANFNDYHIDKYIGETNVDIMDFQLKDSSSTVIDIGEATMQIIVDRMS